MLYQGFPASLVVYRYGDSKTSQLKESAGFEVTVESDVEAAKDAGPDVGSADVRKRFMLPDDVEGKLHVFSLAIEMSLDGIIIVDLAGHITYVNAALLKMFGGVDKGDLLGRNVLELVVESDRERATQNSMECLRTGEGKVDQFTALRKDGTRFPVEVTKAIIKDEHGVRIGFVDIVRDATERKKTEEALRNSELRFRSLYENSYDAFLLTELRGGILMANPAACRMFGMSEDEIRSAGREGVVVSDQRLEYALKERQRTGRAQAELTLRRKDGSTFEGEVTSNIFVDSDGTLKTSMVIRDVTKRKDIEETLRQSKEKYRLLFTNMRDGFVYSQMIYDEKGKPVDFVCLEVNDAFERLTGLQKANVVGKKIAEAVPGLKGAHPELFDICGKAALTGENQHFEIYFKSVNIWLSASVHSPSRGYFEAVFENITEQRQLSKKLLDYSQELELAVAERTKELREAHSRVLKSERMAAIGELAGMVGHDLRNPLAAIKNAAYFLRKKQGSFVGESGNEMLTVIDKAVEQANAIITELLDYSREIRLELGEYSPKSLVDDVLPTIGVPDKIKITGCVQEFPMIWVDVNKMERVFINLIKNAFEAMPNGGTLDIASCQNGRNIDFTFADTGVGMPNNVLAKLFTPFFTTKSQGMGFGLAICKRIVEAHGGNISVESTVGKGTRFTVSIPLA